MALRVLRGAGILLLLTPLAACEPRQPGGSFPGPRPSPQVVVPSPPPPPPTPVPQPALTLGQTTGHFIGHQQLFEFTSQSQGTLVVRLDWVLIDSFIAVVVDGHPVGFQPPVVARVPVRPGQKVTIALNPGGTGHEYDERWTLTLSME